MSEPVLAIVIPSYRRVDCLERCLVSVLEHRRVPSEILVVDDGSANRCVSVLASRFHGVRVLRNDRSRGFAATVNRGIGATTAPIVHLLNDDATVTAGWDSLVSHFENPTIGAVTPLVLQAGTNRIDTAGDEYDTGGFARKRQHNQHRRTAPTSGRVSSISAAAGFYRREALEQTSGFAESFGSYFEDVDLSLQLRKAGWDLFYDPASIVWHEVSASHGRNPKRRLLQQQSRNEEWLFWRERSRTGQGTLKRHFAVLLGKSLKRWQEGHFVPWLTGRIQAAWPSNPASCH
ncbi:MAG: glycosyltransferase family 2 protein [Gemmataceae bacterium]